MKIFILIAIVLVCLASISANTYITGYNRFHTLLCEYNNMTPITIGRQHYCTDGEKIFDLIIK